ncbi:MAG TPA: tetratricopeptide repeat protein [Rhodanobacteraceae bacterium]|nr:tetratricopeptide repeat protein [Rhodanobacteraceae bacterium]
MTSWLKRGLPWLVLVLALGVTALVYIPGLSGGFIYDDLSFIVQNAAVQVGGGDLRDWVLAAFSFPGGNHQGRWLGMLTFAANYYFGELDPFGFKLVNLAIHLLNGCLVFFLLRGVFALRRECANASTVPVRFDGGLAAAAITGLWLVLPINLTVVLYSAQRLESLSTTFVLLGLAWYVRARLAVWREESGPAGLWLSLILCALVGVLVKESAAMLPLYAACIEFAITRGRNRDGTASRAVRALYAALLVVPFFAGLYWLASWITGAETYARSFTTGQRLLSEARVLVDYVQWSLVPSLDSLTLYHDDIAVSRGLFDPPSTALSIAALLALAGVAAWQRTGRPLFALGIAWFFCGHLLTATVIPLLLAFEHRNYFPSLGLLLAVASLLALEGGLRATRIRWALAAAVMAFYATTTWMRAEEWSDPLRLALSEASKRPESPAAQYDRAAAMVSTGTLDGRPLIDDALIVLEDNAKLPGASILFEAALISLNSNMHRPVDPAWWDSLIEKLKKNPPSIGDASSLDHLNECFNDKECTDDPARLADAYAAAMAHPSPSAYLLSAHGQFAWHLEKDPVLAEREFRAAVARAPRDPQARRHLVGLLIATGQLTEARAEVDAIREMNFLGMYDKLIGGLDGSLRAAESKSPSSPKDPHVQS